MALNTRKPPQLAPVPKSEPDDDAFERVMSKAPDYRPDPRPAPAPAPEPEKPVVKARRVGRPTREDRRVQITHTMPEAMMAELEAVTAKLGIPRASVINLAIRQLIERERS